MQTAVFAGHVDGAMTYTAFAINNKQRVRALAVAMDKRHPLMPDVPTFKELGVDWVDGAYRGIGMPKSSTPEQRKRMSELWAALNSDPEMKELAAKSGFELVDVGVDGMDAFMKEKIKLYTDARRSSASAARSSDELADCRALPHPFDHVCGDELAVSAASFIRSITACALAPRPRAFSFSSV